MNYNYAVINKQTKEQIGKTFCSMSEAFDYANKLNKDCGKNLYNIIKVD